MLVSNPARANAEKIFIRVSVKGSIGRYRLKYFIYNNQELGPGINTRLRVWDDVTGFKSLSWRMRKPMKKEVAQVNFDIGGGMWSKPKSEIHTNCKCSDMANAVPCKHCHSIEKTIYSVTTWINPAVVISRDKNGYISNALCVSCIVEVAEEIGLIKK